MSRNQEVHFEGLESTGIQLVVKREDELHPHISGNKFRKLKYNLREAAQQGHHTLLTFGGAYSNHISATAYAGKKYGLKTIGIIRGEELQGRPDLIDKNPTLSFAREQGMQLEFVSREMYRSRHDEGLFSLMRERFGSFYLVPEGGTNDLAIRGCEEILSDQDALFDYVCVSVGTGGTMMGLINSARENQRIIGFPSLKGEFLDKQIKERAIGSGNWSLIHDYHFGGYAKVNEKLISFINEFYQSTTIPLDPVYTGKMMYGLVDMIRRNQFEKNCRILAIHTGGLQGIAGMNQRLKTKKLPLICVGED